MFNVILNASVTGAIVILLWCVTYPLSKKHFKASWHYAVIKIAMIFMLVPISLFAPMVNHLFEQLSVKPDFPDLSEQMQVISIKPEAINSVNSVLSGFVFSDVQDSPPFPETDGGFKTPDDAEHEKVMGESNTVYLSIPNIPYLQLIWLTGAIALLFSELRKIHKFKKQIFSSSDSNVDPEIQELLLQCRKQLGVQGKIALRISEYIKTPLVFGTLKPLIVLPSSGMNPEEQRLAIIHELTHIKNGDLWMKFFASVISVVHWFNPCAYLLRRMTDVTSEEYCDECVVRNMEKEERLLYCTLILKVVSDVSMPQAKFCSMLSAPAKNMKRRLSNMLNSKKSHKGIVALSIITAIIMCSFATVYAFAANVNNINEAPADEPQKKVYNENFYNELEEMYNYLISINEFTGTFEDFKSEVKAKMKFMEGIMQYGNGEKTVEEIREKIGNEYADKLAEAEEFKKQLEDGIVPEKWLEKVDIENARKAVEAEYFKEYINYKLSPEEAKETLEQLNAEIPKMIEKYKELEKIRIEFEIFVSDLLNGDLTISEIEQKIKIRSQYPPVGRINWMLPLSGNKITLDNGVIIDAPEDSMIKITFVENADSEIQIAIKNETATITQPDGTSSTVPAGTVLDGQGMITGKSLSEFYTND